MAMDFFRSQGLYFRLNRDLYNEAAQMIVSGEYTREGRNIILPEEFDKLSLGIIRMYKRGDATDVLFCHAGFAGELNGYVYSSDGTKPMPGAFVRPLKGGLPNWYSGSNEGCTIFPVGTDEDR